MTARSQPIMHLIISLYVKNHPEECRIFVPSAVATAVSVMSA